MKNSTKIILTLLSALLLTATACHKVETEGVTHVTNYAVVTINGDEAIALKKGDAFTDPGATAIMGGEDVTNQIVVTSTVDANQEGLYSVSYAVTNKDGFQASVSRMVVVIDVPTLNLATSDLSGEYSADISRFNSSDSKTATQAANTVTLTKVGESIYHVSCLLGGWYGTVYPEYIPSSLAGGHIVVLDDGEVIVTDGSIAIFGDGIEAFAPCSYDFPSSTLTLKTIMSAAGNFEFSSTLVKK